MRGCGARVFLANPLKAVLPVFQPFSVRGCPVSNRYDVQGLGWRRGRDSTPFHQELQPGSRVPTHYPPEDAMRVIGLLSCAIVTAVTFSACSRSGRPTGTGPMGLPSPSELQPAGSLPSIGTQSPTGRAAATASRKKVAEKEEPATLIANDRTRCTVTADRFKNTRVGDDAICDWRTGDRAP